MFRQIVIRMCYPYTYVKTFNLHNDDKTCFSNSLARFASRVFTSMSVEWPVVVFTHILRLVLSYPDQYFLFKLAEAIVMLCKNSFLYVSLFDETRNYQYQL